MRNSRFVLALVAVACAAALPAAAAAHKGKPESAAKSSKSANGHPGKNHENKAVRLSPVAGQTAKGVVELKQYPGALTVRLVVAHLTPGAFYAAHVHAGSCLTPGAAALTLPDIYANERGVARLVTTLPTAADANYLAGAFSVDVHAGPTAAGATAVISCGDIAVKAHKVYAKAWLKGAGNERGRAELVQKGTDVSAWVKLSGLTPGAHAVHIHSGTCAAPGTAAVSLGDVTAGFDGTAVAKIAATSSTPVVGTGFSLDVHAAAGATPGAVVACGDLRETDKRGHRRGHDKHGDKHENV
jgi:Cu/Zn superoxide dismutase